MPSNPSVAIIGAGISGLSCAQALQRAGLQVSVFEKSRGVAGRMSTRRGDGWECDHGTQYFTATSIEFEAEVSRWIEAEVAEPWCPRLVSIDVGGSIEPVAKASRFVGTPRMTSPAGWLAEDLQVTLNTAITGLTPRHGAWFLDTATSVSIQTPFDWVVFAMPAPQIGALLEGVQTDWGSLLGTVGMMPCWTVMAQVEGGGDPGFEAAFVSGGPLGWIALNNSKPRRLGSETWTLQATDTWSQAHLEDPAEAVEAELIAAFQHLTGLRVLSCRSHRWRYSSASSPLETDHLIDRLQSLGACGDWAGGSKVQAAWLSGLRLAEAILEASSSRA